MDVRQKRLAWHLDHERPRSGGRHSTSNLSRKSFAHAGAEEHNCLRIYLRAHYNLFVNVWLEQHLSLFPGLAFLEEHEPHVVQTLHLERLRTTTCALARLCSSF